MLTVRIMLTTSFFWTHANLASSRREWRHVDTEVAQAGVPMRHKKLRQLDNASKADERGNEGRANAVADAEGKSGSTENGSVLKIAAQTVHWAPEMRQQRHHGDE